MVTGKERAVAGHGVAQEPLVGRFLARLLFDQVKFTLVADKLLPRAFDACGQGDGGAGGDPEAQIVASAGRRR